jgi:Tol biopolymer transport system component
MRPEEPTLIGHTLAHYRVTAAIGAGGMGEVYRAADTKLGRDVALKVLPAEVTDDAERLARFRREAQLLASLNHPNIAAIYGIEEANGHPFLVLELVEGEDLAERLKRGALPLPEALGVARQIAEALEAAHEKGIVHRDLKPANVKLTPGGQVKVLDFGLARAFGGEGGAGSSPDLSQSPTLVPNGTQAGVILGTAAYMAPEQARGRAVDARADVWALGCVAFEMLTGHPPFSGDTLTDVIASVVTKDPLWSALPAATPPAVRRMLQRSLAKERRDRLHHVADARLEIEEALRGGDEARARPSSSRGRQVRELVAWGLAGLAVIAALLLVRRDSGYGRSEARAYRFTVPARGVDEYRPAVISPDGRHLAFTSQDRLWLRPLDRADPVALEATDGAKEPFWSPDSRSIGFFSAKTSGNTLKTVGISGAPPETVAEVPAGWATGTWSSSGAILVEVTETADGEGWYLVRPGAAATRIRPFPADRPISPDKASPLFLPDGVHFLFTQPRGGEAFLQVGSIESGETQALVRADSQPAYAAPGFVLYVRDGALLAQPFDARARRMSGDPQRLLDDLAFFAPTGVAGFSVSQQGTLVVRHRQGPSRLAWLDRDGRETGTLLDPDLYGDLKLSPDGRRLAVSISDPRTGSSDIWLVDLERKIPSRLTSSPRSEMVARWSPDGQSLAFSTDWQGPPNVYLQDLVGGPPRPLVPFDRKQQYPWAWTPDGGRLVYTNRDAVSKDDLWITDREGKERERLLATEFTETEAALSPEGRFMAFTSDVTGDREIYLQSFPGGEGRARVSSGGGFSPRWRGDGRELFYVTRSGQLMAVPFDRGSSSVSAALPRPLFRFDEDAFRHYDVTPNGQRFLFNLAAPGATAPADEVIVGWTRLLRR